MKTRIYFPIVKLTKLLFLAIGSLQILLTGSVIAQSPEDIGLRIDGAFISGERTDFKDYVKWSARVVLTIRNNGVKPVILLDRCFDGTESNACSQSITFFADKQKFSSVDTGEIVFFEQATPENVYPLFWRRLLAELDQPTPSSRLTTTIEPGGMLEFPMEFVIKQKIWTKTAGNKKVLIWEDIRHKDNDAEYSGIPLSDASSFVMSFSFVPMEPVNSVEGFFKPGDPVPTSTPYRDAEFLRRLRSRWREIGIFPLNSSGTFSITSGKIINGEYKNKSK